MRVYAPFSMCIPTERVQESVITKQLTCDKAPKPPAGGLGALSFVVIDLALRDRAEDDLGYLPPGGVVAGAERAVLVAGDDAMVVGGLHVPVEGVVHQHVSEGGFRRLVGAPALGED